MCIRDSSSPYDDYTFERFIVGSSNKFAHAAALSVSQHPAAENNPLFIYGNSGLGKTHLMYAIANVIRKTHPEFRIIYVKGEDFTNELITAIQAVSYTHLDVYKRQYRKRQTQTGPLPQQRPCISIGRPVYLPTQKSLKMRETTASVTVSPVISPSAAIAPSASITTASGVIPD